MFFRIKELELRKIPFAESFAPGEIDFSASGVVQVSPVESQGVAALLENTGGEIRIQGTIRVTMESACDRCLGRVSFPLDQTFDLFYRPLETGKPDEEIEIDEGETEIAFYEEDGVDLADVLREQVLLALPMQRVCREDCKGICPVCGANRNETACGCSAKSADDRWAALKNYNAPRSRSTP
jgi:uncharacterized protein